MKLADRVVAHLAYDVEAIIAGLAAALTHLDEWTGEYPGTASGAPPATAGGISHDDGDDTEGAVLTRTELLATTGDPAMRHRLELLGRVRAAARLARTTMAAVDGVELPIELDHESQDLAVLRWAARRLRTDADRVNPSALARVARQVETIRRLVDQWQPPTTQAPTGCRLHQAAGDHVEIARHFRGSNLCRRCGLFRQVHGVDPSPAILRAWSKDQKPTAGQIAEAVNVGEKKRRKRKR